MTTNRVLVVGQAPSRKMQEGDPPFWNTSALTRLARLCGVSRENREILYGAFDFTNLVRSYPGSKGKFDSFDKEEGMAQVVRIDYIVKLKGYSRVVFLGRQGWDCFSRVHGRSQSPPWFSWLDYGDAKVCGSPHPGGTSFWWNSPANREEGREFWTGLYGLAVALRLAS